MTTRGLVLDSNLLLLLVIGGVEDGRHIETSKRLGDFDIDDYHLVLDLVPRYEAVFITPYIAAEVSNLIDLHGHAGDLAHLVARSLFCEFEQIDVRIMADAERPAFLRFGLTDSSLVDLARRYTILTNDRRLLGALYASSPDNVLPFEIVRAGGRG